MKTIPIKVRLIKPEEDLKTVILQALKNNRVSLLENNILVVASKIVALSQGRIVCFSQRSPSQKIKNYFDMFSGTYKNKKLKSIKSLVFGTSKIPLTLKDGILIPQAGIDFSNAPKGFAILWPKNPWDVAKELWKFFKKKFGLKKIGVIISDSHCQPLRWGTTGLALAFAGFYGVEDFRGKKDLFGKPLKVTKIAVADNLASAALLEMREAAEKIPFVIIRNANIRFSSKRFSKKDISIKPKDCLFAPLYPKSWRR